MNQFAQESSVTEPLTASQVILQSLRSGIMSGEIPPGTRLVHRRIAKQMGTSNIPVIDALRQLEGMGLVVTVPGEGTQVRRFDPQEYEETFRIRAALEGVAYRYFADRATDGEMETLARHSAAYDAMCVANDIGGCAEADRALHLHIAYASRSRELIRLLENTNLISNTISTALFPASMLRVGTPGDHDPVVRALQSRDADLAEEEGRRHLAPVFARLQCQRREWQAARHLVPKGAGDWHFEGMDRGPGGVVMEMIRQETTRQEMTDRKSIDGGHNDHTI